MKRNEPGQPKPRAVLAFRLDHEMRDRPADGVHHQGLQFPAESVAAHGGGADRERYLCHGHPLASFRSSTGILDRACCACAHPGGRAGTATARCAPDKSRISTPAGPRATWRGRQTAALFNESQRHQA